jgi:hypothetical protein
MTVWLFKPREPSGLPHVVQDNSETLENLEYYEYCKELAKNGFEICLHGATSGNNKREETLKALEILNKDFNGAKTFIGHCKNAENIYWGEKVPTTPILKFLLKLYSKHKFLGEDPKSEYFWGDACQRYVRQIRLYRTRNPDTLSSNPSMPYFEPEKPYVNSWFSATKRSFCDVTTDTALTKLMNNNGLTILYHYMVVYVDKKTNQISSQFLEDSQRLTGNKSIWIANVDSLLTRLKKIQKIFLFYSDTFFFVVNVDETSTNDFQIRFNPPVDSIRSGDCNFSWEGDVLRIYDIPPEGVLKFETDFRISFSGRNVFKLKRGQCASLNRGGKTLCFNFSSKEWLNKKGQVVPSCGFLVDTPKEHDSLKPLSILPKTEYYRLFFEQFWIIFREILFKGRILDPKKYLNSSKSGMNGYENW